MYLFQILEECRFLAQKVSDTGLQQVVNFVKVRFGRDLQNLVEMDFSAEEIEQLLKCLAAQEVQCLIADGAQLVGGLRIRHHAQRWSHSGLDEPSRRSSLEARLAKESGKSRRHLRRIAGTGDLRQDAL